MKRGQPKGWPFLLTKSFADAIFCFMEYPVHHEEHIINPAPRKPKKEALIEFYVDIEGTLIDNLSNTNYLPHNCDNISEYIHKHDGHDYKVHIFTWGWVHRSEIELGLVDNLYKRLNIAKEHRGTIYVKEDSVNTLLDAFPDMPYDRQVLLSPGGFKSYELTKASVWYWMIDAVHKFNVLIDDTIEHEIDFNKIKHINPARMKVVIRNHLDKPALLYTPDDCLVGEIKNTSAYEDVRRQIGLQKLHGYYLMFDNQRIDINCLGDTSDNPDGLFDTVLDAAGDLMSADDQRETLFKNIEHIYPQPINPDISDD